MLPSVSSVVPRKHLCRIVTRITDWPTQAARGPGRFRDREGREDNLTRWDAEVRRIFEGEAEHGLRDVRGMLGLASSKIPVTHVVRGQPRLFDQPFGSHQFHATRYGRL